MTDSPKEYIKIDILHELLKANVIVGNYSQDVADRLEWFFKDLCAKQAVKRWDMVLESHTSHTTQASTLQTGSFRVWDTDSKQFVLERYRYCMLDQQGTLFKWCSLEQSHLESTPDLYISQQALQAQDHNGKEVFEGDVLIMPEGLFTVIKSTRYAGYCLQRYTKAMDEEEGALIFLPHLKNWLVAGHRFEEYDTVVARANEILEHE